MIDIQAGNLIIEAGKTLQDYITNAQAEEDQALQVLVDALGLDGNQLKALMLGNVTATNLNDNRRFDKLKESVGKANHSFLKILTRFWYLIILWWMNSIMQVLQPIRPYLTCNGL